MESKTNSWFSEKRISSSTPGLVPIGSYFINPPLLIFHLSPPPQPPDLPDQPSLVDFPPLPSSSSSSSPSHSPSSPPLDGANYILALKAPPNSNAVKLSQPVAVFVTNYKSPLFISKSKTLATVKSSKKQNLTQLLGSSESSPLVTQNAPLVSSTLPLNKVDGCSLLSLLGSAPTTSSAPLSTPLSSIPSPTHLTTSPPPHSEWSTHPNPSSAKVPSYQYCGRKTKFSNSYLGRNSKEIQGQISA